MRGVVRVERVLVALCLAAAFLPMGAAIPTIAASGSVGTAQSLACLPEAEPNDSEDQAQPLSVPSCLDGTLPDNDQDLLLWDVSDDQSRQRWSLSLTGVDGTVTSLKLFPVTSDPGVTPLTVGSQLLELDTSTGFASPPASADDLLFAPGRYMLGISRSGTPGGGDPVSFDYDLSISAGTPNPATLDREPNDDAGHAGRVSGAFAVSGDVGGSEDFLAWTLSETDAANRWQLSIQSQIGASTNANIVLRRTSGEKLAETTLDDLAHGVLHDLDLAAGRYVLEIGDASSVPETYVVSASPEATTSGDAEPNDSPATAVLLDPAQMVAEGTLSQIGDQDDYRFHVDAQLASVLLDIKLVWNAGPSRQLCLLDDTGAELSCRTQDGGDLLGNLFLPVGDYTLEVSGDPDPTDAYVLRVDPTSAPATDFETEPNDDATMATPWTAGTVMRGRQPPGDTDYFKVTTAGAPQLFELQATGSKIDDLAFYRRDGTDQADGEVAADGTSASLEDLYLVPGDHWVRIDAEGDYALSLTPEGPPDPNAEREPNDSSVDAQPLSLGAKRTGRLVRNNDIDINRFSLQAAERLHLTITPPTDGAVAWGVFSGSAELYRERTAAVGVQIDRDLSLPAGDYELWLEPGTPSKGRYAVELDREDPWPPAPGASADVTVSLDSASIAAYWSAGQHVTGQATISNHAAVEQALDLDAVTTDARWTVALGQSQVTLGPGASTSVAIALDVPADAWADVPVRVSVRARNGSGAQSTGHVEITPGRITAPVHPEQAWSVPSALLGGVDVASLALGGAPIPTYDPDAENALYDGLTPAGAGFDTSFSELPVTLTTDLAGDQPLPIAGMILNPLAHGGSLSEAPRGVELWLSDDGVTWTKALSGELSPLPIDQSFVLPSPVTAGYAQLRITSMWTDDSTSVALGEFKVVAAPGVAVSDAPLNVAALAAGGHIVWMDPQSPLEVLQQSLLDEDLTAQSIFVKGGVRPSWVLGFEDDRAAQLTRLEWVDPQGSDATARSNVIDVSVSTDSPLGPWIDAGAWRLKRAADGSVEPFTLSTPTWARYVRFVADAKKQDGNREQPGVLRAIEVPTSAEYRSVLGEFGDGPAADYELQNPPPLDAPTYSHDDNDSPSKATPLAPGTPASSTVHTDDDVDWYDVTVPDGQNTLAFSVSGNPSVGVSLQLQDEAGGSVPMTYSIGDEPGTARYVGSVTPGHHYHVEVLQPPFSSVFTYDTSGSIGDYLSYVFGAIRTFASGVQPGQQAVQIVPFEEAPLLPDWSDDPYALEDAVEGAVTAGGSSSAETALINAGQLLTPRQGAKAVLVVTDAETSSFDKADQLWQLLGTLRPQIFAVQIGADSTLAVSGHYMQDWAQSSDGFYQYTYTHAEMDRAFDRMATWLERPTEYTLSYAASFVKPVSGGGAAGSLTVVGPQGTGTSPAPVPAGAGVAVEVILDTSGSMLTPIDGSTRRIDAAKSVLDGLLQSGLPKGAPVALRILGNAAEPCGTSLVVPLGPLDPPRMVRLVDGIDVVQAADTPLAAAIDAVPGDLKAASGTKTLVLITDSQEIWPNRDLCGKDPAAAIRALVKRGVDASVNIVGLAVTDRRARQNLTRLATAGHGAYYSANGSAELAAALARALQAPFKVLDASGRQVASGVVGGPPVAVKPGTYRVTVLTDPEIDFDSVVVQPGKPLVLTLPTDQ